MKLLDKVAEAYYGGMGENFARKTRERLHWICSKVQGKYVLDVGCSQGITEILLAREGKQVVGIDIEEEAILYAKNVIKSESDLINQSVEYQACSIFEFESDYRFDTVILAEVMEHFSSSTTLLERVFEFVTEDGTVIITVPFGINDYIDHKKTYYLFNLLEEVEPFFEVTEVKFFGKWLGLVARKTGAQQEKKLFSRELIKQLEDSFYIVERALVGETTLKTNKIKELESKVAEDRTIIEQLRQENMKLKLANENLKPEKDFLNHEQVIREIEQTIESKNKEILKRLESEESILKKYKNAIFEYNQLEAKYANVSKKYNLLKNSKLGKLTLKYWKLRKRLPQDY